MPRQAATSTYGLRIRLGPVAPTAALAAPDGLACSAAGSYSKIIAGTPTTFWLVGSVGNYRYWHVVLPDGSGGETYSRSYVVLCSGDTISTSTDLAVTSTSGDRCGTTSTSEFQYVGVHTHVIHVGQFVLLYNFRYWHVKHFVWLGNFGFWVYDHSELARCLF